MQYRLRVNYKGAAGHEPPKKHSELAPRACLQPKTTCASHLFSTRFPARSKTFQDGTLRVKMAPEKYSTASRMRSTNCPEPIHGLIRGFVWKLKLVGKETEQFLRHSRAVLDCRGSIYKCSSPSRRRLPTRRWLRHSLQKGAPVIGLARPNETKQTRLV